MAGSRSQLNDLILLVKGAGHSIVVSQVVHGAAEFPIGDYEVDAWVADVDLNDSSTHNIIDAIEQTEHPIVFEEASMPSHDQLKKQEDYSDLLPAQLRALKAKRLSEKLHTLLLQPKHNDSRKGIRRAKKIWVLAASTGGPKAVSEFLDGIPEGLRDVAFLYAQHINNETSDVLHQVIEQHSPWPVYNTLQSHVMYEQSLYIVSAQHQLEILENGVVASIDKPWEGIYNPSIDQVIAKVARLYGIHAGAVVFTGMGDDGAKSCKMLHHRGGQVWVQSPKTCAVDSMPVSVEHNVSVKIKAAPGELAKHFVEYCDYF